MPTHTSIQQLHTRDMHISTHGCKHVTLIKARKSHHTQLHRLTSLSPYLSVIVIIWRDKSIQILSHVDPPSGMMDGKIYLHMVGTQSNSHW